MPPIATCREARRYNHHICIVDSGCWPQQLAARPSRPPVPVQVQHAVAGVSDDGRDDVEVDTIRPGEGANPRD